MKSQVGLKFYDENKNSAGGLYMSYIGPNGSYTLYNCKATNTFTVPTATQKTWTIKYEQAAKLCLPVTGWKL